MGNTIKRAGILAGVGTLTALTVAGFGLLMGKLIKERYNQETQTRTPIVKERTPDKYDRPNISRETGKNNLIIIDPRGRVEVINTPWAHYFDEKVSRGELVPGIYQIAWRNSRGEIYQQVPIKILSTENIDVFRFQTGRGITGYFSKEKIHEERLRGLEQISSSHIKSN